MNKNSILNVIDNSDIKKIKCIHIYKHHKKNKRLLLTNILGSVKKRIFEKNTITSKLNKALIVGLKKKTRRLSGEYIKFYSNNVLILNDKNKFFSTKIKGILPKEVILDNKIDIIKKSKYFF